MKTVIKLQRIGGKFIVRTETRNATHQLSFQKIEDAMRSVEVFNKLAQ